MLKRDCKYYKISKATLTDRRKKKEKSHNGVWLLFYWHSRTHSDQTPMACSTTCHTTVLQHYYTVTTTVRTTIKVICGLYLENNISYPLPTTFLKLQLSWQRKGSWKGLQIWQNHIRGKQIPHRFSYTDDRLFRMKSLRRCFHPPTWAAICVVESVWHAA